MTVRYWAAARAAAGTALDRLPAPSGPVSLADVLEQVRTLHPDVRFESVVGVCSVLVGERPVGQRDPAEVMVGPGESVELLPPFAGG
ncbi:MoaD/ThiS family protein [Nocardioides mangrovicus]|uniref:MoaD/ThiS family protein n=1 Tax=Nocardioides mangrovicus TaxID=2478913 RepID=A0A3L8NYV9_9ACTN|nr:MoaD/ThiS family protein [Nocardioides mangrovicus]